MPDDTDNDSTDADADDAPAIEFFEMMEFAAGEVADEADSFEGDVPNHAGRLLSANVANLLQTITNIEMARAAENAPDPEDDQVTQAIEEDAVDILLALGALRYEYDLDLAAAFEERMEFIEDYKALEDALEDAETREEAMDAFDEHMDEDAEMPMPMGGMGGGGGIEAGVNVDAEDYDHEETDKSFA